MIDKRTASLLGVALFGILALMPARAGDTFTTLKENTFVCISPEVYDDAMTRVREVNRQDLEPLKKDLQERKQCMFVDAEMAGDIQAPFAIVLDHSGTKVQVQFIIRFDKRITLVHRMINRYVLVGWTDESNLEPKKVL